MKLDDVASRVTRKSTTSNNAGLRRFATDGTNKVIQEGAEESFWDGLKRFGGSLLSVATWQPPWLRFSFSSLWSMIVGTTQSLLHFNWNATDAELDAQIKQAEIAIAAARGAARGAFAGYLICGIAPTAAIAVVNEALAVYTLAKLGEEAADEIMSSVATLIQLQLRKEVKSAFFTIFKNYRGILRPAAIGFAQILQRIGAIDQESVDKANKKKNEPWTIAGTFEDTEDRIVDPAMQAEYEEFWEEFGESCIEAGYIVAGSLDEWFLQQAIVDDAKKQNDHVVLMSPSGAINTTANNVNDEE